MALLLKRMYQGYFWLFDEVSDPRTRDFFLMSSPIPIILCSIGYLYIVLDYGPRFMKNREPFNLDKFIVVFNATQVAINLFLFYHAFRVSLTLDWGCASINKGTSDDDMFILHLVYIYFITKIADLLDTTQFCIMLFYLFYIIAIDCKLPNSLTFFFVGNVVVFLYLFGDFYRKAYNKPKQIDIGNPKPIKAQ